MKILILMAYCLLTAATCQQKGVNNVKNAKTNKQEKIVFIDSKGKQYHAFGDIPERLRTPEQKLYVRSLNDVLLNGVVVENNHMVLKFSKEECLSKGMTEKVYNELMTNLKDNNYHFDSIGNKQVARMIDDMHREIRARQSGK